MQLNSKCVITFTRKQFKQTISIYILQETETMFFFGIQIAEEF